MPTLLEQFAAAFPCLYSVVDCAALRKDLETAEVSCGEGDPLDALCRVRKAGQFDCGLLTFYACSAIWGAAGADRPIPDVEADLRALVDAGLAAQLRKTYADKLRNDDQFDDARYEIAAAATCGGQVLDAGTISLEEPLRGSKKNPDITGTWDGQRCRTEVTVLNENWPAQDYGVQEILESSEIDADYSASVSFPLTAGAPAEATKTLIELLYGEHQKNPGKTVELKGLKFRRKGDAYYCSTANTPLTYVEFVPKDSGRIVQGAVMTRALVSTTEANDLADAFPAPAGTATLDPSKDKMTYNEVPVRQKIRQTLEKKLDQCEEGAINVVVVGIPCPMNDRDVRDAVFGGPFCLVEMATDENGVRHAGAAKMYVTGAGPFTVLGSIPKDKLDYMEPIIDQYRKISAVVAFRIDRPGEPLAEVIVNPNAAVPLTPAQVEKLQAVLLARSQRLPSATPGTGDKNSANTGDKNSANANYKKQRGLSATNTKG